MAIGRLVGLASRFGAADEALLQKIRLHHIHQRVNFLVEGGGEGFNTDGAAAVDTDNCAEEAPVEVVQPRVVHALELQRFTGNFRRDVTLGFDLGKIAHAAQEAIGDAGRSSCPPRNLGCPTFIDLGPQDAGRTQNDLSKFVGRVELQVVKQSETS